MKQQYQCVQWNFKTWFYSMLYTTADIPNSVWKSLYKMANRNVARLQ